MQLVNERLGSNLSLGNGFGGGFSFVNSFGFGFLWLLWVCVSFWTVATLLCSLGRCFASWFHWFRGGR